MQVHKVLTIIVRNKLQWSKSCAHSAEAQQKHQWYATDSSLTVRLWKTILCTLPVYVST